MSQSCPSRPRFSALLSIAVALGCALVVLMAPSPGAGAVGDLAFEACLTTQGAPGCTNLAGGVLNGPLGVAVSPDGDSVYVAAGDRVDHFFAASNGALAYDGCVSNDGSGGLCADVPGAGTPLSGARGVAVSPDGDSVYVASFFADTISHFFAAPQGQITFRRCLSNAGDQGCADLPGAPLDAPSDLAVSGDGRSLYATALDSGSLVHFVRTPGDAAGGGPGSGGGPGRLGVGPGRRCGGKRATIVGTPGNDRLRGTKRADVIVGLGGRDRLSGLGGNDLICGGAGNDRLLGGAGNDRLLGGAGRDRLLGQAGKDVLLGGVGRDLLNGGAGDDRLRGGAGRDLLLGGAGRNLLRQ